MPEIYNFVKKGTVALHPQNLHLVAENSDATYTYFVNSANNKQLIKMLMSDRTTSVVTTKANKNIARMFHSWSENKLYFCDCEYDNTISYIWVLNLSDDSITEITSIPANVYDLLIYDSDLYIKYFSTTYELLEGTINPNGDVTTEWDNTGAGNDYADIDEGSTPTITDSIYTNTASETEEFSMQTDTDGGFTKVLGDCDSGYIHQITAYLYGKGGDVSVDGNQTGMDAKTISFDQAYGWKTAVWSGLDLVKADLDALQIAISSSVIDNNGVTLTETYNIGALDANDNPIAIYWNGSNFFVTDYDDLKVYKYNSDFSVLVASYNITETNNPSGITYYDGYFYITEYDSNNVHKYQSDFTYVGVISLNALNANAISICYVSGTFYVTDTDGYLYKYNSSWTYQTRYWISALIGIAPYGVWNDGTNFYFTASNGYIYKVNSSLNSLVSTFDIGTLGANDNGLGITMNGNYFYVIESTNAIVYEYLASVNIATMYCKVYYYGDTETLLYIKNITDSLDYSNNMGIVSGRSWDCSQICNISDQFYFLWHWSNDTVSLYKFDLSEETFTEMKDCGATTELPEVVQGAISADNTPDYLYFVLGTGTKEVSTIVADIANNINDESYFVYYAIELDAENVRSVKKYNIWFDKAGDSTWTADPADADENIRVAITAGWTAQQVSDAIETAVNADELITCDNAAGTTCTLTCHYNGNTNNINAGNCGLTVATTVAGVDNTYSLYTYSTVSDTLEAKGSFNVCLMLQRNSLSTAVPECYALEKAYSKTELKYFQIARTRGGLNFMGQFYITYPTDTKPNALLIAINNYYLFTYDGTIYELWKFEDVMGTCVIECLIDAEERTWTSIDIVWLSRGAGYQDAPERDQFIQVFGRYSSYTLGAPYYADNTLIAEGLVRTFNLDLEQEVRVESLAQEELNFAPNITSYTNYTGKTSGEVITQLLADYCKTITAGTIVNGSITWTCPADWSVAGDKSIEVILNELADSEGFSWRLRPNCKLDFDAGTVDSQMNFASTDSYGEQEAKLLSQQINQIIVYGGFVNGVQVGPYYANDTNHQLLYGNIVKWSKTYSGIFDATALQTIANNKLLIQGAKPLVYWAERYCTDWGFVQVGETVYLNSRIKVSEKSTQELPVGAYIVNRNKFDAKNNMAELKLSDGMLFLEEGSETLPEQNSELIQQIGTTVQEIAFPNNSSIAADHTAEGVKSTFTAGENLVFGNACYFKSDGKMWKSDADAVATMPIVVIALETIAADATGSFLLMGFIRDDTWAWTVGGLIFCSSATAGVLTQTAPSTAGHQVQVVGWAISADVMYFNPNYEMVEI